MVVVKISSAQARYSASTFSSSATSSNLGSPEAAASPNRL
jgi:hypothetical protein